MRKFSEDIMEARKAINHALDDDSLEALRHGMALVNEYSLTDEVWCFCRLLAWRWSVFDGIAEELGTWSSQMCVCLCARA